MTFKFEIGDIVKVIFYPSIHLEIIGRYTDGLGRNIYTFNDKTRAAPEGAHEEKHLKLVRKAESDSTNIPIHFIILGLIVIGVLIARKW